MRFIFDNRDRMTENVFDEIVNSKIASSEMQCVICFEHLDPEMGNVYTIPSCGHSFHEECVRKWKREKATCPFCRGPLPEELGETRGAAADIEIDNNSIELIRRVLEIIQEMERNQNQSSWWKEGLINILMCPFGILLPPALLLLLWTFEFTALVIGIIALPFLVFIFSDSSQNIRCTLSKIPMILLIILGYPFIVFSLVVLFLVLQVLYSLVLTVEFYLDILRCRRRWRDAYKAIIHGCIGFLEETMWSFRGLYRLLLFGLF